MSDVWVTNDFPCHWKHKRCPDRHPARQAPSTAWGCLVCSLGFCSCTVDDTAVMVTGLFWELSSFSAWQGFLPCGPRQQEALNIAGKKAPIEASQECAMSSWQVLALPFPPGRNCAHPESVEQLYLDAQQAWCCKTRSEWNYLCWELHLFRQSLWGCMITNPALPFRCANTSTDSTKQC